MINNNNVSNNNFFFFQSFKQHVFEPDPERVKQIINKSLSDAEWIFKKVLNLFLLLIVKDFMILESADI